MRPQATDVITVRGARRYTVARGFGISWDWDGARRGLVCALPAVPVLLAVNVSLGVCLALGALPVALAGVPPRRHERPRLTLIGLAFAVAYAAGCVVGQWPVLAVAALAGLAYTGVIASVRRPVVRVAPAVLVPAFALGMNEPVPDGFRLAAVFLAGGAWATVVAWCWREASAPTRAPAPIGRPSDAERAQRSYAICFAAAASLGLAIGYLLDVAHVAWAAAAAIFIMRPDPGLAASRAVGRVLATFAGVLLGALVYHRGPAEAALAMIVVGTVAAMVAVRSSRWYVTAAGSGLLVLLLSGVSSRQEFSVAFHDRVLETAIGAGLALVFGVGIPRLTARRPQSVQGRSA